MDRLPLEIANALHEPSRVAGHALPVVRLLANLSLRARTGWTPIRKAVIDTGATVSLFPKSVWQPAAFDKILAVRAAGVVNRPECTIPATLATVECALLHESLAIGPLSIHALLSDSDQVPLLLGMTGVLDRLRLIVDVPRGFAALEWQQA